MRDSISQLIDRLASKELTVGQRFKITAKNAEDTGFNGIYSLVMIQNEGRAFQLVSGLKEFLLDWYKVFDGQTDRYFVEVLGFPILIGNVLWEMGGQFKLKYMQELCYAWGKCDFTKSLQSIFEEAVWEEVCAAVKDCQPVPHRIDEPVCEKCGGTNIVKITTAEIKQPHIRELFTFLIQTFPVS